MQEKTTTPITLAVEAAASGAYWPNPIRALRVNRERQERDRSQRITGFAAASLVEGRRLQISSMSGARRAEVAGITALQRSRLFNQS